MAQKPFFMDKGIKVGDWTFTQTTDGDLKISSSEEFTSQRPFLVDQGFKIGTMAWYETGQDFKVSEDDSGLDQRPFLADAGIQVGDWVITQNSDLDIAIGTSITVTGGLSSSTAVSSGTVETGSGSSTYTLSGSTASGSTTALANTFDSQINSIYVYNDGQNAIVAGRNSSGTNNYGMVEIEMSTAYDISTATVTTNDFWWRTPGHYGSTEPIATQNNGFKINGFAFNNDGTRMYVGGDDNYIYQYILSTPYNIDGHIWQGAGGNLDNGRMYLTIPGYMNVQAKDFVFNSDGTQIHVLVNVGKRIWTWNLSTAYDLSTASYSHAYDFTDDVSDIGHINGFGFANDGETLWLNAGNFNSSSVYQYDLSTAYDTSTMTYNSSALFEDIQTAGWMGAPVGSGYYPYVFEVADNNIYMYDVNQYTAGSTEGTDGEIYWIESGSSSSGQSYTSSVDFSNATLAFTLDNPDVFDSNGDRFAHDSMDVSGNYAIIGAKWEDTASTDQVGVAYIFDVTTGNLVHTLNNPSGAKEYFGAVSISGNNAIVGGSFTKKAYIYDVTTGNLVHTLNEVAGSTYFGQSVAVSDNYAIVGARETDDSNGIDSGTAYIFDVTTGALLHTLNNPNVFGVVTDDNFGFSVAISDSYAVVGAKGEHDANGVNMTGAAYVFDVATGNLVYTFTYPGHSDDSTGAKYFSHIVDLSDTHVLVTAYGSGDFEGRVYVYSLSDGSLVHTIDNPTDFGEGRLDFFGASAAIDGDHIVVGAIGEDTAEYTSVGVAYIFDANTGSLVKTLRNPNAYGIPNDSFGVTVAISGENIIVGAREDFEDDGAAGIAYIFTGSQ